MDKHIIYLQIFFLLAVVVTLFVSNNLFLKILFTLLVFLFFIKEVDKYIYNKDKYLYIGYGFTSILILFILLEYITSIYFLVFFTCLIVLYIYLYKMFFNTTYGVVKESTTKEVSFKITDPFFKSKKIHTLPYNKKIPLDSIVIVELSRFFTKKKPVTIKKVILNEKDVEKKAVKLKEERVSKTNKKILEKKKPSFKKIKISKKQKKS